MVDEVGHVGRFERVLVGRGQLELEGCSAVGMATANQPDHVTAHSGHVVSNHSGQRVADRPVVTALQGRDSIYMNRQAAPFDDDVEAVGRGDLPERCLARMKDPAKGGIPVETVTVVQGTSSPLSRVGVGGRWLGGHRREARLHGQAPQVVADMVTSIGGGCATT